MQILPVHTFFQKLEYLHVVNHSAIIQLRGLGLTHYDIWIIILWFRICQACTF